MLDPTIVRLTQVYNASNNELVRTNTLVKGAIIQIDATPFRQWYEAHVSAVIYVSLCRVLSLPQYAQPVTKRGLKKDVTETTEEKKLSHHAQRHLDEKKKGKISPLYVATMIC